MKKKYRINEIFHSIQGEGRYTGYPMVFVRFAGCNLNCWFCDTNHDPYEELTLSQITNEILSFNKKNIYPGEVIVCLTGGEPTLQIDKEMIKRFKNLMFKIHLETNGTNHIIDGIDWITISPKESWNIKKGNELKVIYEGQDVSEYEKDTEFDFYYLQPMDLPGSEFTGVKNYLLDTIEKVKKDNPWLLSIQTQKIMNIR